jgi:peroxiredoxin Q/BCP
MGPDLKGKPAPDFTLPGTDGRDHALADYRGRMVVLYFYPKDDTPGCTKEACGFRDLDAQIRQTGAVILGISKDELQSHRAFAQKWALPFELLSDAAGKVMASYGAWGEKVLYGKQVVGAIRSTVLIGVDGVVLRHWKRVSKAERHPEDVLALIKRLRR